MGGSPGPASANAADDVEPELDRTLNPDDVGMSSSAASLWTPGRRRLHVAHSPRAGVPRAAAIA